MVPSFPVKPLMMCQEHHGILLRPHADPWQNTMRMMSCA